MRQREERGNLERETGFEPATSTLARWHSTAELLPQTAREHYPSRGWVSSKVRAIGALCSRQMHAWVALAGRSWHPVDEAVRGGCS
jgi:hypothetical protein